MLFGHVVSVFDLVAKQRIEEEIIAAENEKAEHINKASSNNSSVGGGGHGVQEAGVKVGGGCLNKPPSWSV